MERRRCQQGTQQGTSGNVNEMHFACRSSSSRRSNNSGFKSPWQQNFYLKVKLRWEGRGECWGGVSGGGESKTKRRIEGEAASTWLMKEKSQIRSLVSSWINLHSPTRLASNWLTVKKKKKKELDNCKMTKSKVKNVKSCNTSIALLYLSLLQRSD